ncbi:Processive diacylglycerol beta-glucosyltransferase [Sporomusa silvacetica DSM 10669]|uniref:Processive diacylglycerol beta-glucosyltransferase n=1 Tax=Sporomusa silvacetica DSM 10669 TaxID=1123289 RepID=A0ABZ3IND2_9FIRM|nr:glycosyltransferase [Sporomusa silvacetica]OZC14718.1 processive diacylglycerol beta-glucosyltransferase [Sporomusa silvacetica DSM 10669]
MSKKILLVSASIGSGHIQAANAVRDELNRISPATNVAVVDFLDQEISLGHLIKETYLKMLDVLPHAYDFLYRKSQKSQPGASVKNVTALIMKRKMLKLLYEYRPDMLVFTHPFPCCAAAYLCRTGQLSIPMAAVMTDFSFHPMWLHKEINAYFVANNEIQHALHGNGIANDRIFITGIPISPKFTQTPPNNRTKDRGIPEILIMGGGLGLGAIEEAVISLQSAKTQLKIIAVAGNNAKLRDKLLTLKNTSCNPLTVMGYTERINELMANASLLITKSGALTCSEALSQELPLLLLSPLPGQEEDNANFLTQQGVALRISPAHQLASLVDELLSKPHILAAMRSKAHDLSKPAAANHIALMLSASIHNRTAIFSAS